MASAVRTFTTYGVIYADSTTTLNITAAGSTTTILHGNASGAPTWGAIVNADITNSTIDLTAKVTGTLPIANGGTNATTYGANRMIYMNSGNTAFTSDANWTWTGTVLSAKAGSSTFLTVDLIGSGSGGNNGGRLRFYTGATNIGHIAWDISVDETSTGQMGIGTDGVYPLMFGINGALKWQITTAGIFQSNGAQTIQTSTGILTLATAGGNGNIVLTPNGTGVISTVASLTFTAAASGINLKRGANGKCGTFVANGTTPVTISNTSIAITDTISISLNTVGGTVGAQPVVATITAGVGFTVVCTDSDTSTYNYAIVANLA